MSGLENRRRESNTKVGVDRKPYGLVELPTSTAHNSTKRQTFVSEIMDERELGTIGALLW